jgi:hypothetical protein
MLMKFVDLETAAAGAQLVAASTLSRKPAAFVFGVISDIQVSDGAWVMVA